jgi:hypothetical protein
MFPDMNFNPTSEEPAIHADNADIAREIGDIKIKKFYTGRLIRRQ